MTKTDYYHSVVCLLSSPGVGILSPLIFWVWRDGGADVNVVVLMLALSWLLAQKDGGRECRRSAPGFINRPISGHSFRRMHGPTNRLLSPSTYHQTRCRKRHSFLQIAAVVERRNGVRQGTLNGRMTAQLSALPLIGCMPPRSLAMRLIGEGTSLGGFGLSVRRISARECEAA